MYSTTVKISQRGVITLPKALRDRYGLEPGNHLTLTDMDGVLLLCPRASEIDSAANRITDELENRGESLESMLLTLREERQEYGDED